MTDPAEDPDESNLVKALRDINKIMRGLAQTERQRVARAVAALWGELPK